MWGVDTTRGVIKNFLWRGLPVFALAVLSLLTTAGASHAAGHRPAVAGALVSALASGAAASSGVRVPLTLFEAVDRLPVAEERRASYKRDLYKHWNKGLPVRRL